MKLPATLAAMPMRSKLGLAGGVLAVIVAAFLLLRMAGAPSYTLLASGLDPSDTGKVTQTLDDQGIGYELQSNGTAVAVDKSMVGKARIALATAGVSASGGTNPGFSLFDQQKLGASDFQQQVTYQRALEGQIANTIQSIDGVSGATVQLVLPQDDLFSDTSSAATAAVKLDGTADALAPGAVRGIAQLTASSVKGLEPDNVTITDGTGTMLWPQGDSAGGGDGTGTAKQAAQSRYETQLEADLDDMLARTLGPGKGQVEISADLNMDKVTKDSLTYDPKAKVPLKATSDVEKLKGAGSGAGGTTGTAGNIPQYAAGAGGSGGNSNYNHTVKSTDWGVDKTVAKVEQAPGAVNQLHVALMLDKSVPAAQVAQIKNAVATAAGVQTTRGDTITSASVAFPKPATLKAGPVPATLLGPIKYGAMGLATLLFAFFTWRFLRRREGELVPAPSWLTEINEPVRLAELEAGASETRQMAALPPRVRDESMQKLDQLMDREPERVAAQVRQWMQED